MGVTFDFLVLTKILTISDLKDVHCVLKVAKIFSIPSGGTPQKVGANYGLLVALDLADLDGIDAITIGFIFLGRRYNGRHTEFEFAYFNLIFLEEQTLNVFMVTTKNSTKTCSAEAHHKSNRLLFLE